MYTAEIHEWRNSTLGLRTYFSALVIVLAGQCRIKLLGALRHIFDFFSKMAQKN